MRHTLIPDLLLDARGARGGVGVTVEDGRVVGVGPATDGERLAGRALAPGFVNDHSHAFQRGLRGVVERIDPSRPHDDFWTWRERMYALAEGLDEASIRETSRRCFEEMLRAGYTSVTEFHYVHHRPDGTPYDDPNALAKAVARAAEDAGIRLLILPVAYERGGVPRFRDKSIDGFLGRAEELRRWAADRPLVEVGVAAHSVRAVSRAWLEGLAEYARANGLPLHIHADEQPREIEECLKEHGMRPVELLAEAGFLGPRTTIVHATHADDRELDLLAEHGASVCACPTTEGNLGDGFLPADGTLRRGIPLSVGSDSHVRVDPFEELREIETNARRLSGRRNVLVAPEETSPTPWLLRAGWGRESIEPGAPADFVELDLEHPNLADVERRALPSALVFGAGSGAVAGAWVAGKRIRGPDGSSRPERSAIAPRSLGTGGVGRQEVLSRPVAECPASEVAGALTRSFAGYLMPVEVDARAYEQRFRPENLDPFASRVYFRGGSAAGVLLVARRGWTSRVAGMGVAREERARGLGRRIMREAIRDAEERRDRAMVLEVFEQNVPAVNLYKSLGFQPRRRLVGYGRDVDAETLETADSGTADSLSEMDPLQFARVVAREGEPDPPWMLAAETLAATGAPARAYHLDHRAYALIGDPSGEPLVLISLLVRRADRRRGWGTRLLGALHAAFPNRAWTVAAIVPEQWAPEFFEKSGWTRQPLAQLEMRLELPGRKDG